MRTNFQLCCMTARVYRVFVSVGVVCEGPWKTREECISLTLFFVVYVCSLLCGWCFRLFQFETRGLVLGSASTTVQLMKKEQ